MGVMWAMGLAVRRGAVWTEGVFVVLEGEGEDSRDGGAGFGDGGYDRALHVAFG